MSDKPEGNLESCFEFSKDIEIAPGIQARWVPIPTFVSRVSEDPPRFAVVDMHLLKIFENGEVIFKKEYKDQKEVLYRFADEGDAANTDLLAKSKTVLDPNDFSTKRIVPIDNQT